MPKITLKVASGADDRRWFPLDGTPSNVSNSTGSADFLVGGNNVTYFRLTGATLPQGAVINAAVMRLRKNTDQWSTQTWTWYGHDVDTSTTETGNLATLDRTTASVAVNDNVSHVDNQWIHWIVTPIVQEIVDRGSFSETALAMLAVGASGSTARKVYEEADDDIDAGAELIVIYDEFPVTASANDAFQNASSTSITSASSVVDATNEYHGYRFMPAVPQGATITSCVIHLCITGNGNDEPLGIWWGDDSDDAAAFSAASSTNISARTPTTATVAWDVADLGAEQFQYVASPSLVSIAQEIVDRTGFDNDHHMVFIYQGDTGARDLGVYHWDTGSGTQPPILEIAYTTSGPTEHDDDAPTEAAISTTRSGDVPTSAAISVDDIETYTGDVTTEGAISATRTGDVTTSAAISVVTAGFSEVILGMSGLVAYWPLDETSGTTANDLGPNNLDGTYGADVLLNDDDSIPGHSGGVARFVDDDDSYVSVADNNALDVSSAFTLLAWVRESTRPGNFRYIAGKLGSPGSHSQYTLYTQTVDMRGYTNNQADPDLNSLHVSGTAGTGVVWDGDWHLVALVWSTSEESGAVRLYVDGGTEYSSSREASTSSIANSSHPFYIGAFEPGTNDNHAAALIGHVALFNRTLTDEELDDLYAAGMTQGPTEYSGNVPTSAAISATRSGDVPTSAILSTTETRTGDAPASAAISATNTGDVPTSAAITSLEVDYLYMPVVTSMGTAGQIDDLNPDGFTWAQGYPHQIDQYGNWIVQANGVSRNALFAWSNDDGATWDATGTLHSFQVLRASFVVIGTTIYALWLNTDTNAVLLRTYTISYSGEAITGIAYTSSSATLDTGLTTAQHPVLLLTPDGDLLAVWGARANSGNEIRAARCAPADATTASNWVHLGTDSSTTITQEPSTDSYTALVANSTGAVALPSAMVQPDTGDLYLFYHSGGGEWRWRRFDWGGSDYDGGTTDTLVSSVVRAGSDTGYSGKQELGSKPVYDPTTGRVYFGFATWANNTDGDSWSFCWVESNDSLGTLVDVYTAGASANGSDVFITGDLSINPEHGWLAVAYTDLPDKDVYVEVYRGATQLQDATLMYDVEPFDIPTLYEHPIDGKLVMLGRDFNPEATGTSPTYSPPYQGWVATMLWGDVAERTGDVPTEGAISATVSGDVPTEGAISVTYAGDVTTEASISTPQSGDTPTEASISATRTGDAPTEAALSATRTGDVPTEAAIGTAQGGDVTTEAVLSVTRAGDVTTEAALAATRSGNVPTSAVLSDTSGLNQFGDVPTEAALSATRAGDTPTAAAITVTRSGDVPTAAAVSEPHAADVPTSAAISGGATAGDVPTDAAISVTLSGDVPGSGAVAVSHAGDVPTAAIINQPRSGDAPTAAAVSAVGAGDVPTAAGITTQYPLILYPIRAVLTSGGASGVTLTSGGPSRAELRHDE